MTQGRAYRILLCLLAALFLTACAEGELALHVAKRLQRATAEQPSASAGVYKVGKPYEVNGVWYYPREDPQYSRTGIASWYGAKFHGRRTANGEIYDMNALTAAHKTLPMPVRVRVTNLGNGRSLVLRVNDRGPFVNGRIIDVSRRAAQLLGFKKQGTAKVRVTVLDQDKRQVVAKRVATPEEQKRALPALPRENVTAQTLAPPPGVKRAQATTAGQDAPVRIANAAPIAPAGPVAQQVTQRPVGPSSIFVQAGAFALAENASKQRARLAYIGPSSIINVFIKGQEMFRVRMGPLNSVEAADKVLQQVLSSGVRNARIVVE
ncbi:MAG: septal ring lytic transglycosylase RlpA family protein [Alphaproteobacteria bacterium]|jgi:rare lipoprotein A|nr:septal ring lytic transglycosylase RlpA family protein [Alphaproteobacteria bacterium]